MTAAEPDLTICDRELITRLDRIQSFGFLLALSNDWTIVRCSENLEAFLGVSAEQALGQRFDSLISEQATHDIRNRMGMLFSTGAERLYGVTLLAGRKRAFDVSVHLANDHLIIEGEDFSARWPHGSRVHGAVDDRQTGTSGHGGRLPSQRRPPGASDHRV